MSSGVIIFVFPSIFRKSVLKPIYSILEGIKAVESADYSQRLDTSNNDEFGVVAYYLNSLTNTLVKSEQMVREYTDFLEVRVKQRTNDLNERNKELLGVNQELAFKKNELERLNIRQKELFQNIAHELRTPLTVLSLLSQQLSRLQSEASEIPNPKIKLFESNIKRLTFLVDQIIDLQKAENKAITLSKEVFSLAELTRDSTANFMELAENKQITFISSIPNRAINVIADKDKLEKIIVNVVSNAIKFTPENGTVHLEITQSGTDLIITCKDTGIGIEKKRLATVFNRFETLTYDSKGYFEGIGLGLAITKEYVEAHQGRISIDSELNQGTEISITLPIGLLDSNQLLPTESSIITTTSKEVTEAQIKTDSKKTDKLFPAPFILLVEDNSDLAKQIQVELEENGFLCKWATTGLKALELMKTAQPELIICDILMPEMDGFEFIRQLKQDKLLAHIPVIMLTTIAEDESKIHFLKQGVNDYLRKPFDSKELFARVENLIEFNRERKQTIIAFADFVSNENSPDSLLDKLVKRIEERIGDVNLTVDDLAPDLAMSRSSLYREIKKETGLSPASLIKEIRLQYAKRLVESGEKITLNELSSKVGFLSPTYFNSQFENRFGFSVTKS